PYTTLFRSEPAGVVDEDAGELREGDRQEREVDAADGEAETQIADDGAHQDGKGYRGKDSRPGPDAELDEKHRARIGADADEEGVPQRQQSGKADHQVPG